MNDFLSRHGAKLLVLFVVVAGASPYALTLRLRSAQQAVVDSALLRFSEGGAERCDLGPQGSCRWSCVEAEQRRCLCSACGVQDSVTSWDARIVICAELSSEGATGEPWARTLLSGVDEAQATVDICALGPSDEGGGTWPFTEKKSHGH